jgi:putative exporter of polyketide antibiotics
MSYSAPPPPDPSGGYGGGYAQPRTNQKALWSMILGIVALVCCGVFAGIPALILGNSAKKEITASGGAQTGAGMAQAGVILGIIAIVLSVLGLILFAAGVVAMPDNSTSP